MKLIYYRNKDGKIVRHHLPPKGMTPEQLATAMEEFNNKGEEKVFCQEIADGSLEMHLYEMAQYRRCFPQEVIRAVLDAIDEARDAINCLETEG